MSERLIIEAARLDQGGSALARWRAGKNNDASFMRVADAPADRRGKRRRSARLHSGKTLDRKDAFLCDCAIRDRTEGGARLTLARNIATPAQFLLYEDDSGDVYAAQVVWRRGADIGCRLSLAPLIGKAHVAQRMKTRCYAL